MKFNLPYTKNFLALSLLLAIVIWLSQTYLGSKYINSYIWYIYIYMIVIMHSTHFITSYGFGKTPYDAQNFFMLSTSLKLMLSCVALFLYFYFIKQEMKTFILNFFIIYFSYTFFEIKSLLLSLQPHSKGDTEK
jgi:hypothetical protein